MDLDITEEQAALQDSLRRYIARDYGFDARRRWLASDDGFSRDAWATYAELGILALTLPDDCGGLGGNAVDTMLVMQALAPALVLEPYVATVVLAGSLVAAFGSAAQRRALLAAVGEGRLLLALAHHEAGGRYALSHVGTTAARQPEGWLLSGRKSVVLGGTSADRLLVSARSAGAARDGAGVSLFLVDRSTPGVSIAGHATHDGQRAADVVLNKVVVGSDALVGTEGDALPAIERALDRANAALVAEAVGVMAAMNDATLDHLKTRRQFGQPIGKFQVLQHRMAEMAIATEHARSMAMLAAVRADSGDDDVRRSAVSGAKAYVSQQARFVGQSAVQLHGGMGVTDELIVAHYFKRLTMIGLTFGDTDHHLARYSRLLQAA